MDYPGFIGPSDTRRSLVADSERTVNLYPETIQNATGKSESQLYGTPGSAVYYSVPNNYVVAMKQAWDIPSSRSRTFVVYLDPINQLLRLYDMDAGTSGAGLALIGLPPLYSGTTWLPPTAVFLESSGNQLLIAVNMQNSQYLSYLYVFTYSTQSM